jgi:hypothetical protein
MSDRRFFSWPPGWRRALPWGVLLALLAIAPFIVAAWTSDDRMVLADLVCCYPFLVLILTLLGARSFTKAKKDEDSKA